MPSLTVKGSPLKGKANSETQGVGKQETEVTCSTITGGSVRALSPSHAHPFPRA